jgi:hypothetical protein
MLHMKKPRCEVGEYVKGDKEDGKKKFGEDVHFQFTMTLDVRWSLT